MLHRAPRSSFPRWRQRDLSGRQARARLSTSWSRAYRDAAKPPWPLRSPRRPWPLRILLLRRRTFSGTLATPSALQTGRRLTSRGGGRRHRLRLDNLRLRDRAGGRSRPDTGAWHEFSGVPVVSSGLAATQALKTFGVRRIALIHPPWFEDEMADLGATYFPPQEFEVVTLTATPLPKESGPRDGP